MWTMRNFISRCPCGYCEFCSGIAFGISLYLGFVVYPDLYSMDSLVSYSRISQYQSYEWQSIWNFSNNTTMDDGMNVTENAGFPSHLRIICVVTVITNDINYLWAITQTYSKRCDQLIFYGSSEFVNYVGLRVVVFEGASIGTWNFMVAMFLHLSQQIKNIFQHHQTWIVFVDDMTYVIVDNLKYYMAQNPNYPIFGRMLNGAVWESQMQLLDFDAGVVIRLDLINAIIPHLSTNGPCLISNKKVQYALANCCNAILGIQPVDAKNGHDGQLFVSHRPEEFFERSGHGIVDLLFGLFMKKSDECCPDMAITFGSLPYWDFYFLEYSLYHLHAEGIHHTFNESYVV